MSFEVDCQECEFSKTLDNRPFANAYRIDHKAKTGHAVDFQEVASDGGERP